MSENIAFISISDQLGGAEQVLFQLAEYYANDKDNNLSIIIWGSRSNSEWELISKTIKIIYCNKSPVKFLKAIRQFKFDKTYASHLMINAGLGFLRTIKLFKTKRLIVRESTSVFGRYTGKKLTVYKLAYRFGYRNIDLIICQTYLMKNVLLKHCHYLTDRSLVKVIPNPFKYPENFSNKKSITFKEEFIVSAGRLIPEKGFDVLIHAFKKVLNILPHLKLLILGEGPERAYLESLISNLSLVDKVHLLGHQSDVYLYFKSAKVCVVSSKREGFPNVLLQMMSQNNKVVSTLCAGGISEISGLKTCKPDDVNALSKAILESLKDDSMNNRILFDQELNSRNIDSFMKKVYSFI